MSSVPDSLRQNIGLMSDIVQREQEHQLASIEYPLSADYLAGVYHNGVDKKVDIYQTAYECWEDTDPEHRVGPDRVFSELAFLFNGAPSQELADISRVALQDLKDIESFGSTAEVTYN